MVCDRIRFHGRVFIVGLAGRKHGRLGTVGGPGFLGGAASGGEYAGSVSRLSDRMGKPLKEEGTPNQPLQQTAGA